MQWDSSANAGFSSHTPWLKVNPNYKDINVKDQLTDKDSVLSYYKKLLALRKSPEYRELFTYGKFLPLFEEDSDIFAYERTLDGQTVAVLANFGPQERTLPLKFGSKACILLNNQSQAAIQDGRIILNSCQVIVITQASSLRR